MKSNTDLLPDRLTILTEPEEKEDPASWEKHIREYIRKVQKSLRKKGKDTRKDYSETLLNRRIRAVLDYTPRIIQWCGEKKGLGREDLYEVCGNWFRMNFAPVRSPNEQERDELLLCGAAIWVLDMVSARPKWRAEVVRMLPRDRDEMDDLTELAPELWHPAYERDLIIGTAALLRRRNRSGGPAEMDDEDTPRVLHDSLSALGKRGEGPDREHFDALMAMLPPGAAEEAARQFQDLLWAWIDRFYACLSQFQAKHRDRLKKANALVREQNALLDEMIAVQEEMEKQRRKHAGAKKPAFNPLLVNPVPPMMPDMDFAPGGGKTGSAIPLPGDPLLQMLRGNQGMARMMDLARRMEGVLDQYDGLIEELNALDVQMDDFLGKALRLGWILPEYCGRQYGPEVAREMKPLSVPDPFAVCFGMLWMIEKGEDLAWLYGPVSGLMEEVGECLPWGLEWYEKDRDPVLNPEAEEGDPPAGRKPPKPAPIPDWYQRNYQPAQMEEFPRSLAQILYEETGCVMPRDMHRYDVRQTALREYGVNGKNRELLLQMSAVVSLASRQASAMNAEEFIEEILERLEDREEKEKGLSEEEQTRRLEEAGEQNKQLRAALHSAERAAREAREELAAAKSAAALEHRELADLRELLFARDAGEPARPEEPADESGFPYEVQKDTLIFGGHETWLKAIRPMLTGNVRFVDKDLVFDPAIVRRAEMVWVQTNALSHSRYYRLVDAARLYRRPVRYFTQASAAKCAEQVRDADC